MTLYDYAAVRAAIDRIPPDTVTALMLKATGEDWDELDAWKLTLFAEYILAAAWPT
ncbi:MAG TPA: hypothetical protein VN289_00600 [Paraburkholderia sp.]|nr:hypothetical protein [Paraburkholderia sp.]